MTKTDTVSPLRQRMIEYMAARKLNRTRSAATSPAAPLGPYCTHRPRGSVEPGRLTAREPISPHGFGRLVQGGEDPPFSNDIGEAAPSQIRKKIGADARQEETDVTARKILDEAPNGFSGGNVDVHDRFGADNKPIDRRGRLVDQLANFVGETIGVGVKEICAEPIDDQSRSRLQTGLSGRGLPYAARVGNEHHRMRLIALADMADRDNCRHAASHGFGEKIDPAPATPATGRRLSEV